MGWKDSPCHKAQLFLLLTSCSLWQLTLQRLGQNTGEMIIPQGNTPADYLVSQGLKYLKQKNIDCDAFCLEVFAGAGQDLLDVSVIRRGFRYIKFIPC